MVTPQTTHFRKKANVVSYGCDEVSPSASAFSPASLRAPAGTVGQFILVPVRIRIQQPADHPLIGRVITFCRSLEEIDTPTA
jgi:hypothetical protein